MINRKHLSQNIAFGLFRLLSLSVVLILFAILGLIVYKGIRVVSWDFLTTAPADGMTGGGILPAIVGTFCLMIGSALFAFPVGVMSGIYMNEYAPKGWIVRFIRMMTNNLSGIPSIAVSYTHLDVYKRQRIERLIVFTGSFIVFRQFLQFPVSTGQQVFFTHLFFLLLMLYLLILPQVSFKLTVRLNTIFSGVDSRSTLK